MFVISHAKDELDTVIDHLLYEDAINGRAWTVSPCVFQDLPGRLPDLCGSAGVEMDTANIRLVRDISRLNLQSYGPPISLAMRIASSGLRASDLA